MSVPGYYGELKRSAEFRVKGMDRYGKNIKLKGFGLLAEALGHETDHMDGVLYIDYIQNEGKLYGIQ